MAPRELSIDERIVVLWKESPEAVNDREADPL